MKLILAFGRSLWIYLVYNTIKDFQGLKNIKTATFEGYWRNIATKIHRNKNATYYILMGNHILKNYIDIQKCKTA